MGHIIRKIEEKDVAALVQLCAQHADFEQASYEIKGKHEQFHQALFATLPKLFCYVIESGGELGGYFSYTFDFSTWDAQTFLYLDCLYLEPQFRGMKIGEAVFEKLKEIGIAHHCVNIQWQTPIFNQRAIKFYDKIGAIGKDKRRFFIQLD